MVTEKIIRPSFPEQKMQVENHHVFVERPISRALEEDYLELNKSITQTADRMAKEKQRQRH